MKIYILKYSYNSFKIIKSDFLPCRQIHPCYSLAGTVHPLVGDVRDVEDPWLYYGHVVAVITENPGQTGPPHLLQLLRTEARGLLLVPQSVASPDPLKLISNYAEKGRTQY